jgi:DNA-binding response OmpR family regulator
MLSKKAARDLVGLLNELHAAHAEAARCAAGIQAILSTSLAELPEPERPYADTDSCTVHWRGKTCYLGNTLRFRLFARLARRPNLHLTYHQLRTEVWLGQLRTRDSVRSVVRHLKQELRDAGMDDLADAITGHGQRYALVLDSAE